MPVILITSALQTCLIHYLESYHVKDARSLLLRMAPHGLSGDTGIAVDCRFALYQCAVDNSMIIFGFF